MDEYIISNFNLLPLLNKADIVRRSARFLHAQADDIEEDGRIFKVAIYILDSEYVEVICNAKYQIVGVWMCRYEDLDFHINNIQINYAFNFK